MSNMQVDLDGTKLDPVLLDHLLELKVETTVGLPDVCTIRFAEGEIDDPAKRQIIDNAKLKLGSVVAVKLSKLPQNGATKTALTSVFDGEITSIEADIGGPSVGGHPRVELVVTAHDKGHRMHRRTTQRTFRQMTVLDVARKMAGEHGLKVGKLAPLKGSPAEALHQFEETDWAFLTRLVRDHGGELDVAAGELHIVDPTKTTKAVGELKYGEDLLRFRPRISSLGQMATVKTKAWDAKQKQAITGTGTPKASTTVGNDKVDQQVGGTEVLAVTGRIGSQADADAFAAGVATRLGAERVRGEAHALGDPLFVAGAFVDILGVGTRFGGTHRIVSAVHHYGPYGYDVRLTLGGGGRPLAGTPKAPASAAQTPIVAIVTSNKDPDKLGRIKVKYPTIDDSVESGWARIAHGAAGKARGTVTLPEVNDEVLVVFEAGDARRPYVIGVLFNGKDTPGADLVKASSSLASRFPRDLDVATQANALLKTGNDIKVESEKGLFDLKTQKDVKVEAATGSITITATAGQIKANGKGGVEISASGPLKISSTAPVTVESNAALSLKGSVVQVSAQGVLQLSGATVMLG